MNFANNLLQNKPNTTNVSGIFLYILYEYVQKNSDKFINISFEYFQSLFIKKEILQSVKQLTSPKEASARIIFEYSKIQKSENQNNEVEYLKINHIHCILSAVSCISEVKKLLSSGNEYYPYIFDEIRVDTDVYFKLNTFKLLDNSIDVIKFDLITYEGNVHTIQSFVQKTTESYQTKLQNKLGSDLYYFNHFIPGKTTYNPPSTQTFYEKNRFITNRTLDNVFFSQRDELRRRLDLFMNHSEWYSKRGIPLNLGLMFYGPAGTGKSSCIKAIANITHRHILNIKLNEIKTVSQLNKLFYDETMFILENGKTEAMKIPIEQRLYVIEDIDAMESIVLKRDNISNSNTNTNTSNTPNQLLIQKPKNHMDSLFNTTLSTTLPNSNEIPEHDKVNLSALLNVIDGTLETVGRLLIITTNFPERIDKALIRPSRIDLMIEFTKATHQMIEEMFLNFYDHIETVNIKEIIRAIPELSWSPAELSQIFFRFFNEPIQALEFLRDSDPKNIFRYSHWDKEYA